MQRIFDDPSRVVEDMLTGWLKAHQATVAGTDNPRVVRFYERLGFRQEGTLRQDTWHDGVAVDAHLMSVLAGEHRGATR